jgi:hypothetical protein
MTAGWQSTLAGAKKVILFLKQAEQKDGSSYRIPAYKAQSPDFKP